MSLTGTRTTTYTVADIRKVVENFAADFSMMAQATGLRTRENVAQVVSDLNIFAEYAYLKKVSLFLRDKDGNKLRIAVYDISDSAAGWKSEAPGNNLWPSTPGGSLSVVADLNQSWWNKADTDKAAFIKKHGLHFGWEATTQDTSATGLNPSTGQKYASNGYGWARTNYSRES